MPHGLGFDRRRLGCCRRCPDLFPAFGGENRLSHLISVNCSPKHPTSFQIRLQKAGHRTDLPKQAGAASSPGVSVAAPGASVRPGWPSAELSWNRRLITGALCGRVRGLEHAAQPLWSQPGIDESGRISASFKAVGFFDVYHRPADLNTPASKHKNIANTANHTSSGTTQAAMSMGTATRLGLMVARIARVYVSLFLHHTKCSVWTRVDAT
jgi:hypothetical protein